MINGCSYLTADDGYSLGGVELTAGVVRLSAAVVTAGTAAARVGVVAARCRTGRVTAGGGGLVSAFIGRRHSLPFATATPAAVARAATHPVPARSRPTTADAAVVTVRLLASFLF